MTNKHEHHKHYHLVAQAIEYLVAKQSHQPSLLQLAQHLNISESHLQRVFTQWAGISPKQFIQYLTTQTAKQLLIKSSVLDSALASGLSGSGRLHDLLIRCESVTPGEIRNGGKDLVIYCGSHSSPFGLCYIAQTRRGIIKLSFYDTDADEKTIEQDLKSDWPNAEFRMEQTKTLASYRTIFPPNTNLRADGKQENLTKANDVTLLLRGTPFQIQVWEALLKIPEGKVSSYQQIAKSIDRPKAVRAVASAVAKNKIAYMIPCHRVIRSSGALSKYRWGVTRKAALIMHEQNLEE